MQKYLAKRLLWIVILMVGLVGIWQGLSAMTSLVAYFQRGADPASALNIVPNVPSDLYVSLKWQTDDPDTGRVLEPATRTQIESAYLRAWLQWNLSFLKNEPYGLQTYFVGPALAAVTNDVSGVAAKGWSVAQVDTAHNLQLHFYSADGSIISFTDQHVAVAQVIRDKTGAVVFAQETEARYEVVMLLEDGNWRVRHWVRTSDTGDTPSPLALHTPHSFVGKMGAQLTLNGQPYSIKGINYYPKDTPWDKFWPHYSTTVTDHDFTLIHNLGLNTIRIFLPFDQLGGPRIGQGITQQVGVSSSSTTSVPLEKLADLLQQANTHRLKVIVTLFDFRADYSLLLWPQADRYLETLLTRFKNNATILAWDIKNEPDRDYKTAGKEVVNAWLAHTAWLAHRYDPHHLLTIGWSTIEAAKTQVAAIDLVSFHYYAPASELAQAYASLRTAIPEQPIVLTEFGLSTWNSWFFPGGHDEAEQATYYAALLQVWHATENSGYLAWTLYDFNTVPSQVAGLLPWQNGPQKDFGLVNTNGTFKPAAYVFMHEGTAQPVIAPSWKHALKPFDLTLLIIGILVLMSIARIYQLRRRRCTR